MADPKDDWEDVNDWEDVGATPLRQDWQDAGLARLRAAKPRPPAKDPGFFGALTTGGFQGFFKGGADELGGALTRLRVSPGNGAAWRTPEGGTKPLDTGWDVYRAGRDTMREDLRGAHENWPKTTAVSQFLGDVASDMVAKGLGVPGVGGRAYNVGTGMASGLLGSEAELTPDKVTGGDAASAALSTVLGGAAGDLGTTVGDLTSRITPAALRWARGWLERRGLNMGRRVLMAGSDTLVRNEPVSDDAVREALASGAIVPGGTTQGAFKRLEGLAAERGAVYASILEELEKLGVKGPDAQALADRLLKEAGDSFATSGSDKSVANILKSEAENVKRLARGATLDIPNPTGPMRETLPLSQAELLKRDLQDKARYGLQTNAETVKNEARKQAAAALREGIEGQVDKAAMSAAPGSDLDAMTGAFMPVKERLARTLAAREAAEKGAAAAEKRAKFGLTDYLALSSGAGSGMLGTGGDLGMGVLGGAGVLLGHRMLRNRGPSTAASTAYWLSRAAGAGANAAAGNPAGTAAVEGLVASKALQDYLGLNDEERVTQARLQALADWVAANAR